MRTGDIAVDDRWANVPRTEALHPAMAGESETLQLFAKILHHVVALKLAVNEHVNADLLLEADGTFNLSPDEIAVAFR